MSESRYNFATINTITRERCWLTRVFYITLIKLKKKRKERKDFELHSPRVCQAWGGRCSSCSQAFSGSQGWLWGNWGSWNLRGDRKARWAVCPQRVARGLWNSYEYNCAFGWGIFPGLCPGREQTGPTCSHEVLVHARQRPWAQGENAWRVPLCTEAGSSWRRARYTGKWALRKWG